MEPVPLPDSASLFHCFCAGWYPMERRHTDPPELASDLEEIDLPAGVHLSAVNPLNAEGMAIARQQIKAMEEAAITDWQSSLGVQGDVSRAWLDTFEEKFRARYILDLVRSSDPSQMNNPWLVVACETGAMLGLLLRQQRPALQWIYDLPYWDSALFDLNTRVRLPVFHWAFKRMSADGVADTLADKMDAALAFIRDSE